MTIAAILSPSITDDTKHLSKIYYNFMYTYTFISTIIELLDPCRVVYGLRACSVPQTWGRGLHHGCGDGPGSMSGTAPDLNHTHREERNHTYAGERGEKRGRERKEGGGGRRGRGEEKEGEGEGGRRGEVRKGERGEANIAVFHG